MSDLTGMNIDPNVEESGGDFTVLEPGKYPVVIVGDRVVNTKAGTGKILEIKLQVVGGRHAGETLIDRLNIMNPSTVAQKIGQGVLKTICKTLGEQFPPANTANLYGKKMTASVDVEEFVSNNTGKTLKSNKIKGYSTAQAASEQPPLPPEPAGSSAGSW